MVARTPPLPSTPEILKGLKFKQRSCHRYHTHFGRNLTPGVALAVVDAFAKFKERAHRGFIPKRSGDPDHAPFGEKILPFGRDLP